MTESCVALVDLYREMMKTSDGRTAIFHILRSSLFVNRSTLQKPSELQEAPESKLRIKDKDHNKHKFLQSQQNTILQSFITWQLIPIPTLSHYEAIVQEYEGTQTLTAVSTVA